MRIFSVLEPRVYKTVNIWILPSISVHTEKYWGVKKGFSISLVFLRYCAQVTIWRTNL